MRALEGGNAPYKKGENSLIILFTCIALILASEKTEDLVYETLMSETDNFYLIQRVGIYTYLALNKRSESSEYDLQQIRALDETQRPTCETS